MALSLSTSPSGARILQFTPSYQKERLFVVHPKSINMVMPHHSLPSSTLVFARRRNRNSRVASSSSKKKKIKNLAAELCLDRAIVLEILRDPPPNILMMSAAIPDEPPPIVSVPEVKPTEAFIKETGVDTVETEADVKEPVRCRQQRWFAQKRLKKAHLKTFEMVYRITKRPTDTMISSIVHLTNLPRKRVVKWFEDKRDESGVPGHRSPYQLSNPKIVSPL